MNGYINSFESFGTKDGPGIRFIFFMQGCNLRCLYCHNADTWGKGEKHKRTVEEAFADVMKVKGFIKSGGVTMSGGEPLLQAEFVLELFEKCKEEGIHTCVDTCGYILNDTVKKVLEITDLVLLDIKHIDPVKYKNLTTVELQPTLDFMDYLAEINKPTWLRYVLLPGYTNDIEDLNNWAKYASQFSNIERVDILPFHQMGIHKWATTGKEYQLKDVSTPSFDEIKRAEDIFLSYGLKVTPHK